MEAGTSKKWPPPWQKARKEATGVIGRLHRRRQAGDVASTKGLQWVHQSWLIFQSIQILFPRFLHRSVRKRIRQTLCILRPVILTAGVQAFGLMRPSAFQNKCSCICNASLHGRPSWSVKIARILPYNYRVTFKNWVMCVIHTPAAIDRSPSMM